MDDFHVSFIFSQTLFSVHLATFFTQFPSSSQLTYRVTPDLSINSTVRTPSVDDTDLNGNHGTNLSVFGNAIAPERKPPVPTMSERDVTRRHNGCFTRTRSILS